MLQMVDIMGNKIKHRYYIDNMPKWFDSKCNSCKYNCESQFTKSSENCAKYVVDEQRYKFLLEK